MNLFQKRLLVFSLAVLFAFGLIWLKLFKLQVLEAPHYVKLSQDTSLRDRRLPALRGKILDRDGLILAENRPAWTLILELAELRQADQTLKSLSHLLNQPEELLEEKFKIKLKIRNHIYNERILLMDSLSYEELAKILARYSLMQSSEDPLWDLRGIHWELRPTRYYPYGQSLGHWLGYLRTISNEDLEAWNQEEPGRFSQQDQTGRKGLERTFEGLLRGYDGFERSLVDAHGREVDLGDLDLGDWLKREEPKSGQDLQLTLDLKLSQVAYSALEGKVGAVVAIDPRDGSILTMITRPSIDPVGMSRPISYARYA